MVILNNAVVMDKWKKIFRLPQAIAILVTLATLVSIVNRIFGRYYLFLPSVAMGTQNIKTVIIFFHLQTLKT
jgi:hypothetical protein